jgi:putative tryptophan/tyrosine transport system substrate-binding protein
MRRRDFIARVAGSAAAWPLVARAQQHVRRIGVLFGGVENDPEFLARIAAFRQELQRLGWADGRDVQIDIRWGTGDTQVVRKIAADLVSLAPDVILTTSGNPGIAALQQATRTIPIISVGATDLVGAGFVASQARPGGNITGFMPFEYSIAAKWLELLKQIDPRIKRAGVLRDPTNPTGIGMLAAIQGGAPSVGVELVPLSVLQAGDVESAITGFARGPNGGLIVALSGSTIQHRKLIAAAAVRHKLPAVYPYRFFAVDGGLISYGPNSIEPFRGAASYVDRILKGEKPGDLPVQASTKFELVINLKTAKALGLTVPASLLASANEVIE